MTENDLNSRPITERHVQALWYDGALRPKHLRTTEGVPVRVIDPGTWNVEAGPDFYHAVLEVGSARQRLAGDVEIHLHPSGWRAHGHAADPAYARVIAHVTWYAAPPDLERDGLPASCLRICLGDFLRTRPDFSPDEIDLLFINDFFMAGDIVVPEEVGYVPRGEAWKYAIDGRFAFDGDKPINTHGGRCDFGHAHGASGIADIVEAVKQMRGEAGATQMKKLPRTTLFRGFGGGQNIRVQIIRTHE